MTHIRRKRRIALLCAIAVVMTAVAHAITTGDEGQVLATGHRPTALLLDHAAGQLLVSQVGQSVGGGNPK